VGQMSVNHGRFAKITSVGTIPRKDVAIMRCANLMKDASRAIAGLNQNAAPKKTVSKTSDVPKANVV